MKAPNLPRGAVRTVLPMLLAGWAGALALALIWREPPRARLEGIVLGEEGKPEWGAEILCRGLAGPARGQVALTETDRDGHFVLLVGAGTVEVEARAHGDNAPLARLTLREGERRSLAFRLEARQDEWLRVLLPEQVFTTDETPSLLVEGTRASEVREASVRVDRVDLERMIAASDADGWFAAWGEVNGGVLRDLAPYLSPVTTATLPLHDRTAGETFQRYAELPVRQPGAYLVEVSVGPLIRRSAFTITDLGLVTKQDGRRLLAWTVDLKTGAPRAGVPVVLWHRDGGQPLARAVSGSDGLAWLPLPKRGGGVAVLARNGPHLALTVSAHNPEADLQRIVHLYTDRPIYRPGQTAYLKGIVRDGSPTGYTVPAPQPVTVTVDDGRGHEVAKLTGRTGRFGSFDLVVPLPEEAATGEFSVSAEVGDGHGELSFPVRAYVRPEYSVTVKGPSEPVRPDGTLRYELQADYYFGSPVRGGQVSYTVRRHEAYQRPWVDLPVQPTADGESASEDDSEADDDSEGRKQGEGEVVQTGEARLDERGHLVLDVPVARLMPEPPPAHALSPAGEPIIPGETRAVGFDLEAVVRDGSGRREQAAASGLALPTEIGLELKGTDPWVGALDPIRATVVARDADHAPVAGLEVVVETYHTHWFEDGPRLREVITVGPTQQGVTGSDGRLPVNLSPNLPGEWAVVARAVDAHKRPTVARENIWVSTEGGQVSVDLGPSEADLELRSDRKHYHAGETARLRLRAKRNGHALLTREGQSLREARLLTVAEHGAEASVALSTADIPTATVNVTQVHDKELFEESQDLDIRKDPQRVKVTVTAQPATAKPGDTVSFAITTTCQGRPVQAEVSLAVVDESLFALAKDDPGQIVQAFWGDRWNHVRTQFSAARSEYTGGKDSPGPVRKEFPETALWKPNLLTSADGVVMVQAVLPGNLTTWRATAIAHTATTQVGYGIGHVVARQPLMLRLETPRFLTQRDEATLIAEVHNETGSPQTAHLTLEAPLLDLRDRADREVRIADGGRATVEWRARVSNALPAVVRVRASAGSWQDAVERTLPVKAYATRLREFQRATVQAGQAVVWPLPLSDAAILPTAKVRVELAASPADAVLAASSSLIGYPYGCVEQTTSRLLGCLAAAEAARRTGTHLQRDDLPVLVRSGLLRLRRMQQDGGAWGWWEESKADLWMTAYACYGLERAKAAGYHLADDALKDGLDRLEQELITSPPPPKPGQDERPWVLGGAQAFGLFVLAADGRPVPDTALARELAVRRYTVAGSARLALAASLTPHSGLRAETLARLQREAADPRLPVSDLAWALKALLKLEGDGPRARDLVAGLQQRFDGDQWSDTQETAAAVDALCDALAAQRYQPVDGTATVTVNGAVAGTVALRTGKPAPAVWVDRKLLRPGENRVEVSLAGTGRPEAMLITEVQRAAETLQPLRSAGGMAITRSYQRLTPRWGGGFDRAQVGGAKVDDVVEVTLRVHSPQPARYVVVEDALPAGFEVLDRGSVQDLKGRDEEADQPWNVLSYVARDVRDDHVAFFLDGLPAGQPVELRYLLRAALPGRYAALPATAATMYGTELCSGGAELLTIGGTP